MNSNKENNRETDTTTFYRLLKADVPPAVYRTKSVVKRFKEICKEVTIKKSTATGRERRVTFTYSQQVGFIKAFINPAMRSEQVLGISSDKNDTLAQRLAFDIANRYIKVKACNITWVTLHRNFKPMKIQGTGLMIITNCLVDSTEYRKEMLRDLLALNSHIPRIVCTTGGTAYDLLNDIKYPIHGFIHLSGNTNASIQ
jgi:hypothetical protein